MASKPKKKITAEILLQEIDKIFETAEFYQSRESGKRFYESPKFHKLLSQYIVHSGQKLREHAKNFGMSAGTLETIAAGGRLSDNMLGRIRASLSREVSADKAKAIFPGDWHNATGAEVADAISVVSEKLVFLKKVIESSNFLTSENSPIDKIQVLQLVALLGATIEAIHAPFVDKKQTSSAFKWLGTFAKKAAQKGVEKIITDAISDALHAGTHLIHELSTQPGISDLGDLGPG